MVVQWEYHGYSNDDLVGGETPFFFSNRRNRMMIPSDDFLRGIETRTSYRCIKIGVPTMRVPKSSIALSISIIDVGMRQS